MGSKDFPKSRNLTREEQIDLWRKAVVGDKEAVSQLILSIKGLIISKAKELGIKSQDLDDVIQEAILIILEKLPKYDPSQGTKLSTYLAYWIEKAIRDWIQKTWSPLTLPREAIRISFTLGARPNQKAIKNLADQFQRNPQTLLNAVRSTIPALSLEKSASEKGQEPLEEILLLDKTPNPEKMALRKVARGIIKEAIEKASLTYKQRMAIILYYGLDGNDCYTYREIGRVLKVSHERVYQLIHKGLEKIKWYFSQHPDKLSLLKNAFDR